MGIEAIDFKKKLQQLTPLIHLHLDDPIINQLTSYASELVSSNKKLNLTAITHGKDVAEKHIIDSLIPARLIPKNASVMDIGTGGGFPGIPLKIFMPSLKVSLVDSSRKKISFLKYVIRLLMLKNIDAHQYRVETLSGHADFGGQFDIVISRAFTSLKNFLVVAIPFIKPDGCIIAMKGKEVDKEIGELQPSSKIPDSYLVSGSLLDLTKLKYKLPVSGDHRSLVIVKKVPPI